MWIESEHLTNSALLEMRVGDEVQLTACVDHRDDEDLRTADCTIGASWSSSNARAVTVDDGLVRTVAAGSASVGAEYQGARASLLARSSLGPDVPVRWLVGAVRDAETRRGSWGATVQIHNGVFAGVSDETGPTGMYELRDVAGRLQIDVHADGYRSATAILEVAAPGSRHFDLTPVDEGP